MLMRYLGIRPLYQALHPGRHQKKRHPVSGAVLDVAVASALRIPADVLQEREGQVLWRCDFVGQVAIDRWLHQLIGECTDVIM